MIARLRDHLERYEVHEIKYEVEAFGRQISKMLSEMKERQEVINFSD